MLKQEWNSQTGMFAFTCLVQIIPRVRHGWPEELICKQLKLDINFNIDIRYTDDTMLMSTMINKLQQGQTGISPRKMKN